MVMHLSFSSKNSLGFTFRVPYLDGQDFLVSSTKGEVVVHGKKMVVKGKGLPFFKDTMSTGNLLIAFCVVMPLQLSDASKLTLEKVKTLNNWLSDA